MEIVNIFSSSFLAILEIFLIGLIGFFVLLRGVIGECCLRTITNLVIYVTLPCLIFTNLTQKLDVNQFPYWWIIPLLLILMFLLALALSFIYLKLDKTIEFQGEFITLVSFQNCGFLPIPIIGVLFPPEEASLMFAYLFLFTIFFGALLFTVGLSLIKQGSGWRPKARDIFTNPFIATFLALAFVLSGTAKFIPQTIIKPLGMLGETTIPLVMLVVGGIILIEVRTKTKQAWGFIFKASLLKLLALPVLVFLIIYWIRPSKEIAFLLMLQACMPSASTLPLAVRSVEGNDQIVSQTLLWMYLASVVTIPTFLTLFRLFY